MVRGATGVGIMLGAFDIAAVVQQAVENVGGFVRRRRDNLDVVRAMLVRDMGIKAEAGINAVAGIDVSARCPALPAAKELSI
jgi:citrate synthase